MQTIASDDAGESPMAVSQGWRVRVESEALSNDQTFAGCQTPSLHIKYIHVTTVAYRLLRHLYYQHGLLTFLLLFVPVIPGLVETHTRTYVRLLRLFTGDYRDAHEAVRVVFGRRGLKAYETYIQAHPDIIRPGQIFRVLYELNQPRLALTMISRSLTDPAQRRHPLSHRYRIAIYRELPFLLQAETVLRHTSFCHRLISLVLSVYPQETSPEAKAALTASLNRIYSLSVARHRQQTSQQLNQPLLQLEYQLKASLLPAHGVYSMPALSRPAQPAPKPALNLDPGLFAQLKQTLQPAGRSGVFNDGGYVFDRD